MLFLKILLVVIFAAHLQPASATTIMLLKTQTEIFVGADSMATPFDKNSPRFSVCKIQQIDNFFIASAGIYQFADSGRLNIERVVSGAHRKGQPLSKTIRSAEFRLTNAFSHAVTDAKQNEILHNELLNGNVLTLFFSLRENSAGKFRGHNTNFHDASLSGRPAFRKRKSRG